MKKQEATLVQRKGLVVQLMLYTVHAFNDLAVKLDGDICEVVDSDTCDELAIRIDRRTGYFRGRLADVMNAVIGVLSATDGADAREWASSILGTQVKELSK